MGIWRAFSPKTVTGFAFNKYIIKQMLIITFSSILIAFAGSPEPQEGEDPARADCIYQPTIRGYSVLDESNLLVRALGGTVIVRDGGFGRDRIPIAAIRELTPEEKDDLLVRLGKKKPEFEHTPEPSDVEGAEVEELDPADNDG